MTERSEEAVIANEARVREEVRIHKDVGERVQDVHDTVRHTEVEIERIAAGDTTERMGDPRATDPSLR